jgi:signal transduction histidine kinase
MKTISPVTRGPAETTAAVFDRRGQTGRLMRGVDWAGTALGPVSGWSPALMATVRLVLRSHTPMLVCWGPRLIQFYNDPCVPLIGSKHPRAMGQAASECWNDMWPIIGPRIEDSFAGGPAIGTAHLPLLVERPGLLEEMHLEVVWSPVPDDTAAPTGIGGVLGTIADRTAQTFRARELSALCELTDAISTATTPDAVCEAAAGIVRQHAVDIPFALFYLADADGAGMRLAASCGFTDTGGSSSGRFEIPKPETWPLFQILQERAAAVLTDADEPIRRLPTGPWTTAPASALGIPLRDREDSLPVGVLIAGCNPHRRLDAEYRRFFDRCASRVAQGVRNVRAMDEARQRLEKLVKADHDKTAFFSNISHEFRTPLTLMLGPLDDLLRSPLPPEHAREELRVVHRNGRRLLKMVNTLLDFSRIEARRVDATFQATDLAAFTSELAGSFRSAIERAQLRLSVDCPRLPGAVFVDREMWETIVLNLLSNAFKFTFHGTIAVSLAQAGPSIELIVRDTGVGIARQELPHLFERFHRAPRSRSRTYEGTGIGLSLVKELVGILGGTIRVDSVEGRGTTITVSIPYRVPDIAAIDATAAHPREAPDVLSDVDEATPWPPVQGSLLAREGRGSIDDDSTDDEIASEPVPSRPRVLCVDDNEDLRAYLVRLLRRDYDVDTAVDGDAALAAIRDRKPDLVISDVMMPGLDGFELLRTLRDDPLTRALPVLLLSARAGESERVAGLRAGADDYLVKPFSARELAARVAGHLEIARVRKQLVRQEHAARAAIEAGEEERRRVSRELHDEMGQELVALILGLQAVRDASTGDIAAERALARLQDMAEQIGESMHRIAVQLRPAVLDTLGLRSALATLVDNWARCHQIHADFESARATGRAPAYIEATIYRIVQEALNNVSKHAKATSVNVILQRDSREIVTIVEDDGCGFDPGAAVASPPGVSKLGLTGMNERAALVGGTLTIESHPGSTAIFLRIPLPAEDAVP